jgi:short-subunit dehydrogenase
LKTSVALWTLTLWDRSTAQALPYLRQTGGTLISIGVLSTAVFLLQGAYCASKHALKGWLDSTDGTSEGRASSRWCLEALVDQYSVVPQVENADGSRATAFAIYKPEVVAEAILRAAEDPQRDVYVGGAGKLLSVAERISPKVDNINFGSVSRRKDTVLRASGQASNLHFPLQNDGAFMENFAPNIEAQHFQTLSRMCHTN